MPAGCEASFMGRAGCAEDHGRTNVEGRAQGTRGTAQEFLLGFWEEVSGEEWLAGGWSVDSLWSLWVPTSMLLLSQRRELKYTLMLLEYK